MLLLLGFKSKKLSVDNIPTNTADMKQRLRQELPTAGGLRAEEVREMVKKRPGPGSSLGCPLVPDPPLANWVTMGSLLLVPLGAFSFLIL